MQIGIVVVGIHARSGKRTFQSCPVPQLFSGFLQSAVKDDRINIEGVLILKVEDALSFYHGLPQAHLTACGVL